MPPQAERILPLIGGRGDLFSKEITFMLESLLKWQVCSLAPPVQESQIVHQAPDLLSLDLLSIPAPRGHRSTSPILQADQLSDRSKAIPT